MKKDKHKQTYTSLYKPKNENQEKYVKYLDDDIKKLIIAIGPAGTGKTIFACLKGINLLQSGAIDKIVITRPTVSVDEEIGFLPGNIIKKMDPWTKPIFDLFLEYYSKTELDSLLNTNVIEICPLAFMRGRTFKKSFIIADEMQNSSPNQMKMLTTRIGANSKMVITGDLMQSDLCKKNGLQDIISRVRTFEKFNCFYENKENTIKIVEFISGDIERSDIVQKVIDIYDFSVKDEINSDKVYIKPLTKNEMNVTVTHEPVPTNDTKVVDKNSDAALIPLHHTIKFYK